MKKFFLPLLTLLTIAATCSAQTTLVPFGATWKYLDNGTNQGIAWRDSSFNDAAWASGPAQLGYGEADESTVVSFGPSSTNKYTTTYFRKVVNIPNVNLYEEFTFNLYRDDGAVVYVNGKEVFRSNMSAGVSGHTRFAASNCSDDGQAVQSGSMTIAGGNFVSGNNTIAVEIHQTDLSSSDLSFDLQLVAKTAMTGIPLSLFTYGTSWKYLDNGTDQGTAWRAVAFPDATWVSGPGHLGYGDNDEATVVSFGPTSTNKYVTTYFRKNFSLPNAAAFQTYTLNMYRDDGIVIYINGTEVYRNNIGANPAYNTLATGAASDDGNSVQTTTLTLAASNFISGNNVIAVEIHQDAITSSDISFDLQILGTPPTPPPPGGANVVRGPYLQTGTPTSTTIHWKTDIAIDSRVTYGLTPTTMTSVATDANVVTDHIMTISGLTPYTKYYYSVGSTIGIMQSGTDNYFMTSPLPGTEGKYTFWVTGDCGNNSTNQVNCMNRYNTYMTNDTTNGWLLLGDNAYSNGTETEFSGNFFNVYQGSVMKHATLWPAPGNHDYAGSGARQDDHNIPYYTIFDVPANGEAGGVASGTESFYSYDYGNVHFLSLDSYGEEANMRLYDTLGAQVQWIKQDLAANTLPWVVCYWHHPPYTKGSHNSDTEGELINMRTNFIRILERYGVDLILCGHSHDYERSKLMKGHYGNESTFNPATHNLDQSSGKCDGTANSCAYLKDSLHTLDGTVYVVAGSAGQLGGTQSGYPHDALPYANATNGGSLVLEFNGNRMDVKWLCADGVIRDQFTVFKDGSKVYNYTINLGDTLTLDAAWNGQYDWSHSAETSQSVSVTPTATGAYYVTDQYACIADTFHVNVIIPTIDASATTLSPLCAGSAFSLPFATTGVFRSGNIFTAELSDATGSFASPVVIGTLAAISSGTIPVTIPPATPAGAGYQIRIVASSPAITGAGMVSPFSVSNSSPVMSLGDDDADNSICAGDNVTFTAGGATTYEFFINAVSQGTPSSTPTFSTSGLTNGQTVTVEGTNACGTTPSSGITFTVISAPTAAMTVSDPNNEICQGDNITFTGSGGNTYEFLVNTVSQGPPSAVNTFSTTSLTNGQTVQVNVSNGCSTSNTSATITVNALPAPPVAADMSACLNSTIPSLSATGTGIVWYSDAGLTTQVATGNTYASGNTAAGTYTYYATQTNVNGCTSPAEPVNLVINTQPAAPVTNGNAACANTTIPSLTATGTTITWYSNPALTTQVATGNTYSIGNTMPGTYTYYATQTDANGCQSAGASATLTIYAVPTAPTAADMSACFNSTIPSLTATGTGITWYSDAGLTTQVGTGNTFNSGNTAAGTYTYYATQTNGNGCTGPAEAVNLVINTLPAAPTAADMSACFNSTIPSLTATGTGIVWYSDAGLTTQVGAGNTYASGNTAAGTYTYYATQTDANGCTSPAEPVNLVINALPAAPVTNGNTACANTSIPSITATGTGIVWYSDPALTTQVSTGNTYATGNTTPGTYTYYATQTDANGCQSAGSSTTLTIYAVPSAPAVINPSACVNAAIPSLTATGTGILWYSDAGLTTQVGTGNSFNSGNTAVGMYTYYVTQTNANGCVSTSSTSVLTILAQPAAPVVSGTNVYCDGDALLPLTATGTNVMWYANPSPSVIVGTGTMFTPSNTVTDTFYVTQSQSSCVSNVTPVIVTVNPLPVVGLLGLGYQYALTDAPVTMTGLPAGGTFSGPGVNGNQFDPALAGVGGPYTITYTYTDSLGCTNSTTSDVIVDIGLGTTLTPGGNGINVFPNPVTDQTIVSIQLIEAANVNIDLYDVAGKQVMNQSMGVLPQGKHNVVIDREALQLAAGTYWLNVTTGEERVTIKLVVN